MFIKAHKKLSLLISLVFLTTMVIGGTAFAGPASDTIEFTDWSGGTTYNDVTYFGQSFTPSYNISVTDAKLCIVSGGLTARTVKVAIRADMNGDNLVQQSDPTVVSVQASGDEPWPMYNFHFPTPINLTGGTTYYLVISETDGDLCYRDREWPNGGPYAGGQRLVWNSSEGYRLATDADTPDPNLFEGDLLFVITNTIITNRPPVANAGGPYTADEGTEITFDGSGSSDPDGDLLQYRWDFNNDGTYDASGVTAAHTWYDNFTGTVTLEVNDGKTTTTSTANVTVNNVAPTVGLITAPTTPLAVSTQITTSASFTDPGTADTHTAIWNWGDGTTSAGTVASLSVSGSHTYSTPGIYTVGLTVTDDDGGVGTQSYQYVVVYDPNGGFATGGGWIISPAGAYTADPSLSGKANFGFVSKYQKGASTPTGYTEFQFKAGDLNFKSTSYDWLVVAGARAQYKGVGTINGSGEYGFMLTAIDGQINGGGGADKFRIKIWEIGGDVIYDNLIGGEDTAVPTTTLGGGSIVIHN